MRCNDAKERRGENEDRSQSGRQEKQSDNGDSGAEDEKDEQSGEQMAFVEMAQAGNDAESRRNPIGWLEGWKIGMPYPIAPGATFGIFRQLSLAKWALHIATPFFDSDC